MTDPPAPQHPHYTAASLARSVTVTWWYTSVSIVSFQVFILAVWALPAALARSFWPVPLAAVLFTVAALGSIASAVALLAHYRRGGGLRTEVDGAPRVSGFAAGWLAVALASAALVGIAGVSALLAMSLAAYALCLLRWRPGIRLRLVIVLMLAVVATVAIDVRGSLADDWGGTVYALVFFGVMLPSLATVSLWWWDIVVTLDAARAAESRLAAVQERLRLASDLHDLQGHHLQVIALQLELAERMLPRDPDAAIEQVRLARTSVDEARRGTRELAGRFRGVPLPDELANAADLLRAAGLRVELDVAPDAAGAPADVLGPVVRESTTNVLKHGGGAWASLALRRTGDEWMLRIANDVTDGSAPADPTAPGPDSGAGLDGIAARVGAVGGQLQWQAHADRFEIDVTLPAVPEGRAR